MMPIGILLEAAHQLRSEPESAERSIAFRLLYNVGLYLIRPEAYARFHRQVSVTVFLLRYSRRGRQKKISAS